ncbi:MAG: RHS repeat-associated core domain-containing protein [Oleiphilus sp.]
MYSRLFVINFFFFLLFSINFTVHAAIPDSALVGATKGSFSVTPSGTASYNIPIQLPPNVGGVQPSLSLSYDGSAGNGLLGVGWNISGLSAVSRCPTTLERDGYIDGVDFDSNDQFCLDGQRLVHISGNEYRTEIDNFAKITGTTNGFTVVTPSGLTMRYGGTTNSRIYLKGQSAKLMTWVLYKVEDSYGNQYTIQYENNSLSSGEYYASSINMYGKQTLLSHVALEYEDRPDVISGYQTGSEYKISKRLSALKTYTKNDLTRQYLIKYEASIEPVSSSFLASVQECDGDGECLQNLSFHWNNDISYENNVFESLLSKTSGFNNSENWHDTHKYSTIRYVDVTGDGLVDICSKGSLGIFCAKNIGNGEFEEPSEWIAEFTKSNNWDDAHKYSTLSFVDVTGDGLVDVCGKSSSGIVCATNSGQESFMDYRLWIKEFRKDDGWDKAYKYSTLSFIDVTGDGLVDVCGKGKLGVYCARNTGLGNFIDFRIWVDQFTKNDGWDNAYKYKSFRFVDVNADGLPDACGKGRTGIWCATNNGLGNQGSFDDYKMWSADFTKEQGWDGQNNYLTFQFVDVTGDGLPDACGRGDNGIWCAENTGSSDSGFKYHEIWTTDYKNEQNSYWDSANNYYSIQFVDINNDGLKDVCARADNGIWCSLNSGNKSFEAYTLWTSDYRNDQNSTWDDENNYDTLTFADIQGDGVLDLCGRSDEGIVCSVSKKSFEGQIIEISSVVGRQELKYSTLTDTLIYKKNNQAVSANQSVNYPSHYDSIIQTTPSAQVVFQVIQPDGVGGTKTTNYKYEDLRYDLYAKRSLGFSKTIIENLKTDVRAETSYNQSYPYVGMVSSTVTELMSTGQDLSISSQSGFGKTDTSGKKTYFSYASDQTETAYMLNDDLIQVGSKTVSTQSDFNNSGQLTDRTITTSGTDGSGIFTVETSNTYTNGYSTRRQGEITSASVTSNAPNQASITRTSSFEYDWSKGHIVKEVIEPGDADPSITRVSRYGYDSFGNRISTVTCDGNYENSCTTSSTGARYSTVQFSSDGLFAESATNALGHTTSTVRDARFGVVTSTTDINGLTSSSNYDSLGRKISSTNAFNQTATITREWCDASCPTVQGQEAYSKVTTQAPNAPTSIAYFDQYNREIRKEREGFGSETILVDTEYDDFGRVKRTSEPYFDESGATVYWNTPSYDALGRKTTVVTPNQDGGYDTTSAISYQGFTTEITDALGRKIKETKNVMGKVVKMTDKASNDTLYEYDALGHLVKTTDLAGNVVRLSYDKRGRKIEMNDPDMGIWKYKYNTFDQLVEQTDAKNQVTKMVYDVLGRMTSRTDAYGTSNAKTSTWSFYTTPTKSKGKLYQKTAANGDYTRYTYNNTYGQLETTDQKIGNKLFTVKNAYDTIGRVSSLTYPSTTAYTSGFKVIRQYNAKGFLSLVRKDDNSKIYWQANAMSPRGQLEAATYGNGVQELRAHSEANGWLIATQAYKGNNDLYDMTYEFNAVGNIKKRIDALQQDMTEEFEYDDLDRLTDSAIYGGPSGVSHLAKSYSYDDLGNITSKSDVGSYSYNGCGNRPHAVCNAGGTAYSYDANGNMLSGVKGSTTTQIGYTAFNKSNYMQKGNYAVTFNYDADRNRNYKSRIQNGSLNLQTYYVGTSGKGAKIFEQEVSSATGTKSIHYIYGAGGQAVATHITEGTAKRTEYFHRDHLGSVALVTNDAGQALSPVSFDAWGKRRNTNWSDNSTGTSLPNITGNIGFTGQESITEIGLIHMNGRIYDPNLGKFLSADPLIQAPYNSQSYNRYAYVMNNPLSLIDPSGYSWVSKKWKKVKKNWTKIRDGIKGAFLSTMLPGMSVAGGFKAGYTYRKARNMGASSSDALKGGLINGALSDGKYLMAYFMPHMAATPSGFAAMFASDILLNTGVGRRATQSVAKEFFGDFLGIGDSGVNSFLSQMTLSMGIEYGVESFAASYVFGAYQAGVGVKGDQAVAYVAGAGDSSLHGTVKGIANAEEAAYFTWDQSKELSRWIEANSGRNITIIGHSYGADTAAGVIANGYRVSTLLTVDPVSWIRPDFSSVASNTGTWLNLDSISNARTWNNFVAVIGGAWDAAPQGIANHASSRYGHVGICVMHCGSYWK